MIYATLIAVGDYKDIGVADIPTYKRDLDIMRRALNEGLRIQGQTTPEVVSPTASKAV